MSLLRLLIFYVNFVSASFFSWVIILTGISRSMWKKILVIDYVLILFLPRISLLSMVLSCWDIFIMLEKYSSPSLFFFPSKNGCWVISDVFSVHMAMIYDLSFKRFFKNPSWMWRKEMKSFRAGCLCDAIVQLIAFIKYYQYLINTDLIIDLFWIVVFIFPSSSSNTFW